MMMARKPRKKVQPSLSPDMEYNGSTMLPDVKQELFCQLYTSNSTPRFFGHGKNSYAFAYGYIDRLNELERLLIGADTHHVLQREKIGIEGTCKTNGARLLTNANILARCNHLMDKLIEDRVVDRELAFIIQQRHDLSSKTQAIVHYDKKKGRLVEKQESLIKFDPITAVEFILPAKPKIAK